MALSHQHRMTIAQGLAPIIGDTEIADFKVAVATQFGEVGVEFGVVRSEMAQMETRIVERLRQQTLWIACSTTVAIALSATLTRLIG